MDTWESRWILQDPYPNSMSSLLKCPRKINKFFAHFSDINNCGSIISDGGNFFFLPLFTFEREDTFSVGHFS